ncbi:MAG: single-stranded-DNA-specific exonuclease RecJ [Cytophagales bacterium]|nr:single-stranded-DNA-specific exonuclease RecJ [Cytophagales bacterium]
MEKKWVIHKTTDPASAQQLSKALNINPDLSSLLLQRGIDTFELAKDFFRPSLDHLHDPFLMLDMDKAVNRICNAVFQKEKILVYGDYDVDGTTSVALVYGFLKAFCDPGQIAYYIPDRYEEGYGLSEKGVRWAADQAFDLIITLDCGIKANANAALCSQLGIDLIICDHHLPGEQLPVATAILDPKREGCNYPYKELSGCGVGFKLLQGFCQQNTIDLKQLFNFLDLVAISIASDIVPITGENRVLAFYGLKKINSVPSAGIAALIQVSGLKTRLKISDLVFYLGPRINAAGRLSHARESVRLLIGEDQDQLADFSKQLNEINSARKEHDRSTTEQALEMIEEEAAGPDKKSTVLYREDWHKGIVGIVASRCIENYYRPTIILTESKGHATGSARSVEGFDIHAAISECSDLLDQFGGHHHAAGLSMPVENVPLFKHRFEEVVASTITEEQLLCKLEVDLEVNFDFVNYKSYNILRQMAPFGPGNANPVLISKNVKTKYPPRLIKDEHLKMTLVKNGSQPFEAIAFGMGHFLEPISQGQPFSIAFHLDENEYRGNKSLQLIIKDIKIE